MRPSTVTPPSREFASCFPPLVRMSRRMALTAVVSLGEGELLTRQEAADSIRAGPSREVETTLSTMVHPFEAGVWLRALHHRMLERRDEPLRPTLVFSTICIQIGFAPSFSNTCQKQHRTCVKS